MNVKGIVLAGGRSRRFGEDKALARIGGIPLIARVVALLKEIDPNPVVITAPARDYAFLDCRIEHDLIPEQGPLGGLYTACTLFPKIQLLIMTCDMPALSVSVLKTLVQQHNSNFQITVFQREGGLIQPFPGIYDSSLLPVITEKMGKGRLSMQALIRDVPGIRTLRLSFPSDFFANINEKKDITELNTLVPRLTNSRRVSSRRGKNRDGFIRRSPGYFTQVLEKHSLRGGP